MEILIRIPDCEDDCAHDDCSYGEIIGALEDTKERTGRDFTIIESGDDRQENWPEKALGVRP